MDDDTLLTLAGLALAGGAAWWLTRPAAPPYVPPPAVTPGVSSSGGSSSAFQSVCKPLLAGAAVGAGAAYGAPPPVTVGVAGAVAPALCGAIPTVLKMAASIITSPKKTADLAVRSSALFLTGGLSETKVGKAAVSTVEKVVAAPVKAVGSFVSSLFGGDSAADIAEANYNRLYVKEGGLGHGSPPASYRLRTAAELAAYDKSLIHNQAQARA